MQNLPRFKHIFKPNQGFIIGELPEDSVIRKFRITAADGKNYIALSFQTIETVNEKWKASI
ncbi:MAG: hypothetical protein ACKV1O_15380 [Saprospiraceae bacterium]